MTIMNDDAVLSMFCESIDRNVNNVHIYVYSGAVPTDAVVQDQFKKDDGQVDMAAVHAWVKANSGDLLMHLDYGPMRPVVSPSAKGALTWEFSKHATPFDHIKEGESTWFMVALGSLSVSSGYATLAFIGNIGDDNSMADFRLLDPTIIYQKDYKLADLELSIV